MRNALLFFILSCLFFSCQKNNEIRMKIKEAEELIRIEQPDSAFTLLESITNPDVLNDKEFAHFCLVYAGLSEQLGEDMPFVPQMERANAYFEKHGSLEEKMNSLLYLGMSYKEEADFEWAMKSYLRAVEIAKEAKKYLLVGKLYNQIAELYDFDDKYDEAERYRLLSGEYYLKGNDSVNYIYSIRDIGWLYILKEEYGEASEYFLKAYRLALPMNDSLLLSSITNRLGINYGEMKNYSLAEKFLLQSVAYDETGSAPTYLALADLYLSRKDYRNTRYYVDMATQQSSTNPMFKGGLLYQKYLLEKELGNYSLSLDYHEQYTHFADSISDLKDNMNILKVEKRYEYKHLLNENKELYVQNKRVIIICCFFIILCLLLIMLYRFSIVLKEKCILKQQQLIQNKNSSLIQKELELKGLNSIVMEIRENVLKNSGVYKKIIENSIFIDKAKFNLLTDGEWVELKECIKSTYISFFENLQKKFPNLTEEDIRFCCLLKIGLNSQQLSIFLDIQPTSVSRRRNRIMKKGKYENTNTTLEKIIEKL